MCTTWIARGVAVVLLVVSAGCASSWKVHGGPKECLTMCQSWDMELVGMVGVGDQGRTGEGATACVCQVVRASAPVAAPALEQGAAPAAALAASAARGTDVSSVPQLQLPR